MDLRAFYINTIRGEVTQFFNLIDYSCFFNEYSLCIIKDYIQFDLTPMC